MATRIYETFGDNGVCDYVAVVGPDAYGSHVTIGIRNSEGECLAHAPLNEEEVAGLIKALQRTQKALARERAAFNRAAGCKRMPAR